MLLHFLQSDPYLVPYHIEGEWSCNFGVQAYLISWGTWSGWVLLLCWTGSTQPIPWLTASKCTSPCIAIQWSHFMTNRMWVAKSVLCQVAWHILYTTLGQQFVSNIVNLLAHLGQTVCYDIVLSLWVIPSPVPLGCLNICPFYEQKVSASHLPFCESFSLMNTESKWMYKFPTKSKPRYRFNRKWVIFCFFCTMLCLHTTLWIFIDCKVSSVSMHANTSPWLPPLFRWAVSMDVIFIVTWTLHFSLYVYYSVTWSNGFMLPCHQPALFSLFSATVRSIFICDAWLLDLYLDCMFTTEWDPIILNFLDRGLNPSLCMKHPPSSQQL